MSGRRRVLGSGTAVVFAVLTGALTNELHGGWHWWVADGIVTTAAAALAMWLVSSDGAAGPLGAGFGAGAVHAGRDLRGFVRTRVHGADLTRGDNSAPGSVSAGRDISGIIETEVETQAGGPERPDRTGA